jgi:RNA polymerase sigma factor (sigma-70 family)
MPLHNGRMSDVTRILSQIESGDPAAAEELLPLVYDELRKLAAARLAHEKPGQTLQATALVHEAYLRLVGKPDEEKEKQSDGGTKQSLAPSVPAFDHRGHFFAAAAEAMRRILVDRARRKGAAKSGGDLARVQLDPNVAFAPQVHEDLVALDAALERLAVDYPQQAEVVKLRYFAGLSLPDAAAALGISERTAGRHWAFARAWLRRAVEGGREKS